MGLINQRSHHWKAPKLVGKSPRMTPCSESRACQTYMKGQVLPVMAASRKGSPLFGENLRKLDRYQICLSKPLHIWTCFGNNMEMT